MLSIVSFSYCIEVLCVSYPTEESCYELPNSLLSEHGFSLLLLGKIIGVNKVLFVKYQ